MKYFIKTLSGDYVEIPNHSYDALVQEWLNRQDEKGILQTEYIPTPTPIKEDK